MVMRRSNYNAAAAALLREARIKAGLKQSELANRLGVHQQFVSKYETGERRLDVGAVLEICGVLDLSFVDFAIALATHAERVGKG
jgi:transcriptional regulator with XRE-family HTH domain